ncbi:MAG TPA: phosphoribosylamine--glycine ligase [Solirubrobacteraceae bacterium]
MRILVVGSGAREHAIVRALKRSPSAPEVLCAPGNVGIAADAELVQADATDTNAIVGAARAREVDLVVVGPEAPLVEGLTDALVAAGVTCFGPSRAAAELEGSKAACKRVMAEAGVPTAAFSVVRTVEDGLDAVTSYPTVIKADGLAAGKGVVIATGEDEARAALESMLVERRFGNMPVVVEEHLAGEELSLLALCDGVRAVPMAPAQDFKRIGDGDTGPNTGGMGSYSPVPGIDAARAEEICATVHQPVLDALRRRGTPFHGVLYAGLMLTDDGPRVLEFNVRFGDPETQAILPRLRSDLADLARRATREGGLEGVSLDWDPRAAVTVVLASAGYPDSPRTGDAINGLDAVPESVEVTHAGTAEADAGVVTAGGRVLGVTALGETIGAARNAAYAAADAVDFEGRQLRRDIAAKAAERETT